MHTLKISVAGLQKSLAKGNLTIINVIIFSMYLLLSPSDSMNFNASRQFSTETPRAFNLQLKTNSAAASTCEGSVDSIALATATLIGKLVSESAFTFSTFSFTKSTRDFPFISMGNSSAINPEAAAEGESSFVFAAVNFNEKLIMRENSRWSPPSIDFIL